MCVGHMQILCHFIERPEHLQILVTSGLLDTIGWLYFSIKRNKVVIYGSIGTNHKHIMLSERSKQLPKDQAFNDSIYKCYFQKR
jgi:hypothetical protein